MNLKYDRLLSFDNFIISYTILCPGIIYIDVCFYIYYIYNISFETI